jgi:lipopolysaccharide transport system ATP-binding protein
MNSIEIDRLSKSFDIYRKSSDRVREILTFGKKSYHQRFWALKDLSFAVEKGASVGVIGQNGSGKSTLLKILAGLMLPSSGTMAVQGKRASLIELGMGFHSEFTGRANVYLNSALLGIPREVIDARFDRIVEFSGIGDFIDRPAKTYSSGMYLRLAFSVAVNVDPEVLFIDEVLAVGDALFSQKCVRKLREFQDRGVTIFFVSHDLGMIKNLCDEAMLLDQGVLLERGTPGDVTEYYRALVQKRYAQEANRYTAIQGTKDGSERKRYRHGNFDAALTEVKLLDAAGEETAAVVSGETCIIAIRALILEEVENAVVGIMIQDRLGNEIYGTNTGFQQKPIRDLGKNESITVHFALPLNIGPGDYSLTAAIHPDEFGHQGHFDWVDKALSFQVLPSEPRFIGFSRLDPTVSVYRGQEKGKGEDESPLNRIFPEAPVQLEMDERFEKYLLKGWHAPERWEAGIVRWTERECLFVMRAKGERVLIACGSALPEGGEASVAGEIFVNGKRIRSVELPARGERIVEISVSPELRKQVLRLKIVLAKAWSPDQFHHNGDKRQLGIYVKRIWSE